MLARSANACCCVSAVLMYFANPSVRRIISRPTAVRRGIARDNIASSRPPAITGSPSNPAPNR